MNQNTNAGTTLIYPVSSSDWSLWFFLPEHANHAPSLWSAVQWWWHIGLPTTSGSADPQSRYPWYSWLPAIHDPAVWANNPGQTLYQCPWNTYLCRVVPVVWHPWVLDALHAQCQQLWILPPCILITVHNSGWIVWLGQKGHRLDNCIIIDSEWHKLWHYNGSTPGVCHSNMTDASILRSCEMDRSGPVTERGYTPALQYMQVSTFPYTCWTPHSDHPSHVVLVSLHVTGTPSNSVGPGRLHQNANNLYNLESPFEWVQISNLRGVCVCVCVYVMLKVTEQSSLTGDQTRHVAWHEAWHRPCHEAMPIMN